MTFFGIILFTIPFSFTVAWKNGSYGHNDSDYDYEKDYGTHDWIAEAALNALLDEDSDDWTWLKDRKEIYFVGTEAPDNSDVSMNLDGKKIEGFGDTSKHHVYFNTDGSISNNEDDAALRAKSCGDLADASIEENKLDQAAFYFGAMTHYISDLAMYCHVAENNIPQNNNIDFDGWSSHEQHSKVEGYVQSRSNDDSDKEEFFKIFNFKIKEKKPYDAAIDLAWDTYEDPDPSESITRDAVWLHDNFFSSWEDKYEDRSDDTTSHQLYYDRIEENLNNAIEACASAMFYIGGAKSGMPSYPIIIIMAISLSTVIGLIIFELKRNKKIFV